MNNNRCNSAKYIFLIFLAICFLATGGIFVKLSPLPPINTGFYRVLFSIPMLLPFIKKSDLQSLSYKQVVTIVLAGAFLAGDLTFWNSSFSYTTVANSNLLVNLTPFTVIPVSYFLFKEKMTPKFLLGGLVTLLGVFVLMANKVTVSPERLLGDSMSLGASVFYAMFMITVYKLRDTVKSNVIMFLSAFGTLLVLAAVIFFTEGFYVPKNFEELWPLLALALVSQILGQGLLAYCLGKVNASLSSLITLSQPVVAALYAWVIFQEHLNLQSIIAIIITLTGVYLAKTQTSNKLVEEEI
ncbi:MULTISPECIES: DMT family transporter [Streptococcus]|jgi:drug/metabolite transporter (DMT)-like permease|uniref:Permease of the drug/metabolite transporter (DMT) superfamily n=2 Tax=Streptococcus equinus TaxID=1335 RepID=A0A1G9ITX8_STREI|nr:MULTISPECIES: DMT family transporter [Streptococcus]KEY48308.1 transporter [Streptococcus equinus]KFN85850.1 transporter [Streptococcus equinus ATCC 33317]MBE6162365.1 DMT family transporter [Streptococcus equinus]MDO4886831.1 DMT family transporter [Streptococcus sp.]QMS97102.1 DMT family transporter [Streptococcus equinus]